MQPLLDAIKRVLPKKFLKKIRPTVHGFLAFLAAVAYGRPSRSMIIVGITGTAGKSTTTQMLSWILNHSGLKAGYITTVEFFDGNKVEKNIHGMSMPGRFLLQRELKQMLANGCKYAIVESTSEGLAQNRHVGIDYDLALLTNLSEAHIEAHGGFENYRAAKAKLFKALMRSARKPFFSKKIIGVNADDPNAQFFAQFQADYKFGISFGNQVQTGGEIQGVEVFKAEKLQLNESASSFVLAGTLFEVNLPGMFNAYNALLAAKTANMLGVSLFHSAEHLRTFRGVAGRMESIPNDRGIKIYLDYAPEPAGMIHALSAVARMPHNKIIHVFGSTGGHRDVRKRFEFGAISARFADIIIITNDDVYDSDPQQIADDVRKGIAEEQNKKVVDVLTVLDRKQAIKKAIEIAQQNDIIIVTGKGSEQFLVLPENKRIAWDERSVIEEALQ